MERLKLCISLIQNFFTIHSNIMKKPQQSISSLVVLISEFTLKLKGDFSCHISVSDPDHIGHSMYLWVCCLSKGTVNCSSEICSWFVVVALKFVLAKSFKHFSVGHQNSLFVTKPESWELMIPFIYPDKTSLIWNTSQKIVFYFFMNFKFWGNSGNYQFRSGIFTID